jgi:hypothetical protein
VFDGFLKECGHFGFSIKRLEGDVVALQMSIDLFVPAADAVFHCSFQPTVITETGGAG